MVVKKSSRRVGRPRGSRNRKGSRKASSKGSRKRVGRPRGSRNRKGSRKASSKGSRKASSKGSRKRVGRPRGSRNRKGSRKASRKSSNKASSKGSKSLNGIYSLSMRKMIPLSQLKNITTKKVVRNGRTTYLLQAIDPKGNKVSRIISKQDYDNQLDNTPSVYHTPVSQVKKRHSKPKAKRSKTFSQLLSELNVG